MLITKCSRVQLLLLACRCIVLAVFHVLLSLALLLNEKLLIAFTCTTCKPPSISLTGWESSLCCVRRNTLFSINQEPKRQTTGPALCLKQGQTCLNMDLLSLCSRLLETSRVSIFKQSWEVVQSKKSSSMVFSGTLINRAKCVRSNT